MFEYLDIAPTTFALAFIIVTVAAVPQSTMGLGFGLVAASSLLLVDPRFVPGTVIIMGTVVATASFAPVAREVIAKDLKIIVGGRLIGAFVVFLALGYITNREMLSLVIGALILFAVLLSVVKWNPKQTPMSLFVAGIASGVTGTFTSIGAPPLGLVYQTAKASHIRATLNAFFAIGGFVSAIVVWSRGWMDVRDILLAISMLPGLICGVWVSRYAARFINQGFRPLVLIFCAAAAIIVIVRSAT